MSELFAEALQVLRSTFGFSAFRGAQEEIIRHVLDGQNAIVLMPTGGGKSLCYQIPALVRPGTGLVISPLIALMQDQVQSLQVAGVRAAFLNSSLSPEESRAICARLYRGQLDLLYVSPERALMDGFGNMIANCPLSLIAIDEAHCVSQWGHDFRPEYSQLSSLHEQFPEVPFMALTATADEPTRLDIGRCLKIPEARRFISSFDRPNIRYYVQPQLGSRAEVRQRFLEFIEEEHPGEAGIVYCLSRRDTEKTAEWLCAEGYKALAYHAGMEQAERAANQQRFLREEGLIMAATVAFGMGIDKPNVRFVAHFCLPASLEAYYQETGRAGRDGLPASAWMVYNMGDMMRRLKMLQDSTAEAKFKMIDRRKLEALLGFCETTACRRKVILNYFGESDYKLDNCHNCDNCLTPPPTIDGTVTAQKALSCVYRTGQVFGVNHLVSVLRGQETVKIKEHRHDELPTFGVGRDLTQAEWASVFRQLVAAGLLDCDFSGFGGLRLTNESVPVLKGQKPFTMRIDKSSRRKAKVTSAGAKVKVRVVSKSAAAVVEGNGASDKAISTSALFEKLRAKRLELARRDGLPPYYVFHDVTLLSLARERPHTLDEMRLVQGIGDKKMEKYGQDMLNVLLEFDC